jgi:hypothetical protein
MGKTILQIPHRTAPFTCMWNGLEDQYEWKSGMRVPTGSFFFLSGLGEFVYIKNKRAQVPYQVYWSNGITRNMYMFMKDIVGFNFEMAENRSFAFTLNKACQSIDTGIPVILGALDMFHLPYYEKFYHKIHIPIHYVMMVGYDRDNVYVADCGRDDIQTISCADLERAWDVRIPGFSKRNTMYAVSFSDDIRSFKQIVYSALPKKALQWLQPPVQFIGYPGMVRLIQQFPLWQKQLSFEAYRAVLAAFAENTGFPPSVPPKLLAAQGIDSTGMPDNYKAARDLIASTLETLGNWYCEPEWIAASRLFHESGHLFYNMTDAVTDFLINPANDLASVPMLLERIAQLEKEAYERILSVMG